MMASHGASVSRRHTSPSQRESGEEIDDDDIGENSDQEEGEEASTFDPPHEDIAPIGVDVARAAMASLDHITLDTEFRSRGCLMRIVPEIMRGAFRTALRLSFQEAAEATNVAHQTPSEWFRFQSETCRTLQCIRARRMVVVVKVSRADARTRATIWASVRRGHCS